MERKSDQSIRSIDLINGSPLRKPNSGVQEMVGLESGDQANKEHGSVETAGGQSQGKPKMKAC